MVGMVGDAVFFTHYGKRTLYRAVGGTTEALADDIGPTAIDGDRLLFATETAIMAAFASGPPRAVFEGAIGFSSTLAALGDDFYIGDGSGVRHARCGGTLKQVLATAHSPKVVPTAAGAYVFDERKGDLYLIPRSNGAAEKVPGKRVFRAAVPLQTAASPDTLYWIEAGPGPAVLVRMAVPRGKSERLFWGSAGLRGVAVEGSSLFTLVEGRLGYGDDELRFENAPTLLVQLALDGTDARVLAVLDGLYTGLAVVGDRLVTSMIGKVVAVPRPR
jgi:hypothetical protein